MLSTHTDLVQHLREEGRLVQVLNDALDAIYCRKIGTAVCITLMHLSVVSVSSLC